MHYHLTQTCYQGDAKEDKKQFKQEVEGQTINGNWVLVKRSQLPSATRILQCVWAMRRKHRIMDGTVYKWKACLNVERWRQTDT
jgi:hypothetical protein